MLKSGIRRGKMISSSIRRRLALVAINKAPCTKTGLEMIGGQALLRRVGYLQVLLSSQLTIKRKI